MKLNRKIRLFCSCWLTFFSLSFAEAQPDLNLEKNFTVANKQVNQFLRRFNNEESPKGEKYLREDPMYRNLDVRRMVIPMMFDKRNKLLSDSAITAFTVQVTHKNEPFFLEFHSSKWCAEVDVAVRLNNKPITYTLYLILQKEEVGYKWVISSAYSEEIDQLFQRNDSSSTTRFIHPMSHELGFMNLEKVIQDSTIAPYLSRSYQLDYLSIFLYEWYQKSIEFVSVRSTKFHFFQVPNWYFTLEYFNRNESNSGWLISSLKPIKDERKNELYQQIIHR